jgi:hypothetical protein
VRGHLRRYCEAAIQHCFAGRSSDRDSNHFNRFDLGNYVVNRSVYARNIHMFSTVAHWHATRIRMRLRLCTQ